MIKITITKQGLATIGRRGFQEAGRAAVRVAAEHWWRNYLPLHFTNMAYLRYRFTQRDPRTNKYKRARRKWPFGHHTEPAIGEVKPLVFSGRTRERLLSRENIRVRAPNFQTYQARCVLNAPALNFSTGKRIDLRDEITRDHPTELAHMEKLFVREWNKQLRAKGLTAPRQKRTIAA